VATAVSAATGSTGALGAGAASTGAGAVVVVGGPTTSIPDPGPISPQVTVQSPALAPGVSGDGDTMHVPLASLVTVGTPVVCATAAPRNPTSPKLTLAATMMSVFIADPPAMG
jgi:hypothetical protein